MQLASSLKPPYYSDKESNLTAKFFGGENIYAALNDVSGLCVPPHPVNSLYKS